MIRVGRPKRNPAKFGDAQAVHLADPHAARVDERHALEDAFLRAIAQPRRSADFLRDRRFNVGAGGDGAAGLAGPKIGFGQHVVELVDDQRQLVRVIGKPRRVLDQQRGTGAIDRLEIVPPRQRGDQARMCGLAGRRAVDIVLEVGEHLEVLGKIGIEGSQQVVQQPIAEQHHLDVERDRDRAQARPCWSDR